MQINAENLFLDPGPGLLSDEELQDLAPSVHVDVVLPSHLVGVPHHVVLPHALLEDVVQRIAPALRVAAGILLLHLVRGVREILIGRLDEEVGA